MGRHRAAWGGIGQHGVASGGMGWHWAAWGGMGWHGVASGGSAGALGPTVGFLLILGGSLVDTWGER